MDPADHLRHLEAEGRLLAAAAASGTGTEAVPDCPGWTLDDVVRHLGCVHEWAGLAVTGGGEPPDRDYESLAEDAPRDHAALPAWYAGRLERLLDVLTGADWNAPVWQILPEPAGAAVWARRQAHETAIHRYDAEGAVGARTPRDSALADDGIHEVLCMHARPGRRLRTDHPVSYTVHATDTGSTWHLLVDGDRREVRRGAGRGQQNVQVDGDAADLHVFLWNRAPEKPPGLSGDVGLWETWREQARIR